MSIVHGGLMSIEAKRSLTPVGRDGQPSDQLSIKPDAIEGAATGGHCFLSESRNAAAWRCFYVGARPGLL